MLLEVVVETWSLINADPLDGEEKRGNIAFMLSVVSFLVSSKLTILSKLLDISVTKFDLLNMHFNSVFSK